MLLILFNVLLVICVFLHLVQISILLYIAYRLVQDKNAAVGFVKSVWVQLQEDLFQNMFEQKKEVVVNK
jgi:hypothetical protein